MGCRVDQTSFWDLSRQMLVLSSFRRCVRLFNPWHREMQQNLHTRSLFRINALEKAVHMKACFSRYIYIVRPSIWGASLTPAGALLVG